MSIVFSSDAPLTKEEADELMKERGYESVSQTMSGNDISSINYVKYFSTEALNDDLRIHANVSLKRQDMTLDFVELKYLCKLEMGPFSYRHPDFEKWEATIAMYAAKCLDVDVFEVLNQFLKQPEVVAAPPEPKKEKAPAKTVKERQDDFWNHIRVICKNRGYHKEGATAFYKYWIQMNPGGRKMQFEITKEKKGVFDIGGRLATWFKNDKNWQDARKTIVEKKIEQQNKELKTVKPLLKHEELF